MWDRKLEDVFHRRMLGKRGPHKSREHTERPPATAATTLVLIMSTTSRGRRVYETDSSADKLVYDLIEEPTMTLTEGNIHQGFRRRPTHHLRETHESLRRHQWILVQGVEGDVLSKGPVGQTNAPLLRGRVSNG